MSVGVSGQDKRISGGGSQFEDLHDTLGSWRRYSTTNLEKRFWGLELEGRGELRLST